MGCGDALEVQKWDNLLYHMPSLVGFGLCMLLWVEIYGSV